MRLVSTQCVTHDAYEERAAIKQHVGGMTQKAAESAALAEVSTQYHSGWKQSNDK